MTFLYILFFFYSPFFLILDDILRLETPVHVLVGTPGRVCDLAERQIADLSQCNIISIDEADKLLDDFFLPTIEKILATCCTEKQILLFSATFPQTVNIKAKKESEHANGSTVVFDCLSFLTLLTFLILFTPSTTTILLLQFKLLGQAIL